MKQLLIDSEISERLRGFISQRFQARGRFSALESVSGISASKWKNFFYKSQEATQELLLFWQENFPDDSIYQNGNQYIDLLPFSKDVSSRLRGLIGERFQTRGRFSALELASGISASKWKNFYYGKQEATQALLQFWCQKFPESENWLLKGAWGAEFNRYPFNYPAPITSKSDVLSLADRLIWVISEWATNQPAELYKYLSQKTRGKITAEDWEKMILRDVEPTIQMIELVCKHRPFFTEWIINGATGGFPQADPTDSSSIKRWNEFKDMQFMRLKKYYPSTDDNKSS
jgi:hypothetical protein